MLPVEEAIIDCRTLLCLLIEGEHLNEREAAHDLHDVVLVVHGLTSVGTDCFTLPDVGSEMLAGVTDELLTRVLVVLGRGARHYFMTDRQRPLL